ncbi:MAG: Gfo/Idh/MocA family protein [Janthinobacterium lividum]
MPRRLRLGMVGGGQGAFIGAVHRIAARLDDRWELVAGAFSSDPARGRASADTFHVAPDRAYDDFAEMAAREAAREDRVDAVAIVTPNHLHAQAATAFVERGIAVICDKPMTHRLEDALALAALVERRGVPFLLTHNYTGYPLVRQAREMVLAGALGTIRVVQVEYPQEWLTTRLEDSGHRQAAWRTDPAQSGEAGCLGDIGTHAFNLAEFVTSLRCERVAADLSAFVPGRRVDDNAHMLLRFAGGARGMLWSSQVAPGNENGLRLRVYGEAGGLEWAQEQPNQLVYSPYGEAPRVIRRAGAGATQASRIPAGHPEGYLEAFAQLYRDFADRLETGAEGDAPLPGVAEGVRGLRFIAAGLASTRADSRWADVGGP